ncbi:MAG: CopD family protein [Gammaproteobacteria bacterium]|jgi:uncharacterized membrane protein
MTSAAIAIALHALSAVIWVGGMFFAFQVLRPVAAGLFEPPQRLRLWVRVFSRFFPWVWLFVILLPATGYWMVFVLFGGMTNLGLHIHIMQVLGWVMILLYSHLYFAPFRRLRESVITENWVEAAKQLDQIRRIVGINLGLGLIVVAAGAGGRYL